MNYIYKAAKQKKFHSATGHIIRTEKKHTSSQKSACITNALNTVWHLLKNTQTKWNQPVLLKKEIKTK